MLNITKNSVRAHVTDLRKKLPKVFDQNSLISAIDALLGPQSFGDPIRFRIQRAAKEVPIEWSRGAVRNLYFFDSDYDIPDLIAAWTASKRYLSHYSALYWNELVDQQPKEYFFTEEIRAHSNSANRTLNEGLVRMAFMKGYRISEKFGRLGETKFNFIEKANTGEIGVVLKRVNVNGRELVIRLTGIERTLIDGIVAPQYSGGMLTVLKAYTKANFELSKLAQHYDAQRFLYPYWQTIGLVLEHSKGREIADQWSSFFGSPKIDLGAALLKRRLTGASHQA